MTDERGELIAKVKLWFGGDIPDLFNEKYITETLENSFVYIYRRK